MVEHDRETEQLEDAALEGSAESLGEEAQDAVESTQRALRLRVQELEARVSARPPPEEKASDLRLRATAAWRAYKESVGLR